MGFLAGADQQQLTRLELVKLDQSAKRTIDVPFSVDKNGQMALSSGATGVVLEDLRRPDQSPNVYFVNTASNATTKLFTYVFMGRPAEFALSPDGRSILYLLTEVLPPTISAIDIATIK